MMTDSPLIEERPDWADEDHATSIPSIMEHHDVIVCVPLGGTEDIVVTSRGADHCSIIVGIGCEVANAIGLKRDGSLVETNNFRQFTHRRLKRFAPLRSDGRFL